VIREGLSTLNETALAIQASSHTRRPLFPTLHSEPPPSSDKARAEERRIFDTAFDCLEKLALNKNELFTAGGGGDPICLLKCRVKPSIQVAILYWTLPLSVLLDDSLGDTQKEHLLNVFQRRLLQASAESILQKCVHGKLSSYFPPKVRLEAASADMVQEYLKTMDDDDDSG
jgi:hypothetical protein